MRRRGGVTLVEILVATGLAMLLVVLLLDLFLNGAKLFGMGIEAARGPEASILLMDRFEEDIQQVLQAPGDPRPPMRVDKEKHRVTFYRASEKRSTPALAVGEPASWGLKKRLDGMFHPVRDGKTLSGILLKEWELTLMEPDPEKDRPGWYLSMKATFPANSKLGKDFTVARLIFLPQPTTNYMNFLSFGADLVPGTVHMLPCPEFDEDFEHLGPPDPEVREASVDITKAFAEPIEPRFFSTPATAGPGAVKASKADTAAMKLTEGE